MPELTVCRLPHPPCPLIDQISAVGEEPLEVLGGRELVEVEDLTVAVEAAVRKCLVHTHSSENPGELEAVRAATGKDNVVALAERGLAGENVVLAHCVWLCPPSWGRTLAARRSRFRGCPRVACSAASCEGAGARRMTT